MAKIQTGKAVVHGVAGSITGFAANTGQDFSKASLKHNVKVDELPNSDGETSGMTFTNAKKELTINFYPTGGLTTNNTLAQAKAGMTFLTPGATVTTSGFDSAEFNGTFGYIGGAEIAKDASGFAMITLPLVQLAVSTAFDAVT